MKIREFIKDNGQTAATVSKVKSYNEEVDIPMSCYVDIIDESVAFKKLLGFYNLKDMLWMFETVELIVMYTTVAEESEVLIFKCKKHGIHYTIAGLLSVDKLSEGRDKITGRAAQALKNNMLDRDVSHFGMHNPQIGFSSKYLTRSSAVISSLVDMQVEGVSKKTDREYKLGLLVQTSKGLNISVQSIGYDSLSDDVDLLYENIDSDYLDTLLEAIHTKRKGNIIFSGLPGTGKTYFIRKVIKDYNDRYESKDEDDIYDDEDDIVSRMFSKHKNDIQKLFLYVPVNLAAVFSNPEFISLMQNAATEYPKGIVVILEDAEKVVESRENAGSNYSVSDLLDMSDGMLNDIINTQFIFTYNTNTENIDKALLRPGRLLALKEFKKLSPEKATLLARELNIPKTYSEEVTIAEVFKELHIEEETTLIDKEDDNETKIGFR